MFQSERSRCSLIRRRSGCWRPKDQIVDPGPEKKNREINMIAKVLSGAVLAGLLLAVSAPVSFAADVPKDKAACEKAGMKWDATKKVCVPKM